MWCWKWWGIVWFVCCNDCVWCILVVIMFVCLVLMLGMLGCLLNVVVFCVMVVWWSLFNFIIVVMCMILLLNLMIFDVGV